MLVGLVKYMASSFRLIKNFLTRSMRRLYSTSLIENFTIVSPKWLLNVIVRETHKCFSQQVQNFGMKMESFTLRLFNESDIEFAYESTKIEGWNYAKNGRLYPGHVSDFEFPWIFHFFLGNSSFY